MSYERAVPVEGRIYADEVIESEDILYESVEALVLDIQENPQNYGIMKSREIAEIYFHFVEWGPAWHGRVTKGIVAFTVCDEEPDEDDIPEDYPSCGMYDPEGKWWCGWHDDLTVEWKTREITTVCK